MTNPVIARIRPVRALLGLTLALFLALSLAADTTAQAQAPADATRPFDILDNSFFVEEAFNQEPGIFQNIFGVILDAGNDWALGFTQEWPVVSQRHQISYSFQVARLGEGTSVSDVMVNYRYQASLEGPGRPAFSPRLSVIVPRGGEDDSLAGVVGWQVNLPFSKQRNNFYYHWGGGFTWLPGVQPSDGETPADEVDLLSPHLAASAIWRTGPMFNLMLESLAVFRDDADETGGKSRSTAVTISPGLRTGWNLADQQLVVGVAVPVTFTADTTNTAAFVYLSYELPFK